MNNTSYQSDTDSASGHYFRRNSLQTISKAKSSRLSQERLFFGRSCTSFDKINKKNNSQLPQLRSQKQIDVSIFFNPSSRTNYFKNIIDSYFDKHSQILKINKNQDCKMKISCRMKKFFLNKTTQLIETSQKQKEKTKLFSCSTQKRESQFSPLNQSKMESRKHQQKQRQQIALELKGSSPQRKDQMSKFANEKLLKPQNQSSYLQNNREIPFLAKITEAADDDFDEQGTQLTSRLEFTNTDSFMLTHNNLYKSDRKDIFIYQNAVIKSFIHTENSKNYRIKQFKNYIFLKRHNQALQYGAFSLWKPYRFNEISLIISDILPLKDLLFKIFPHPVSPQNYYIQPKPLHSKLTANNCQQLIILFKQFIKDLSKLGKQVINNKINLSNIFYFNGKLSLAEWQHSAFKDENKIQGNHFESRVQPILKYQNEWLVPPEYLAPQILSSVENAKKSFDLWSYGNSSDVYSIGLVFLEIVTLIPMWIQFKTSIKTKIVKPRQGLLSTFNRSAAGILQKQKSLVNRMAIVLERELSDQEKNPKFFSVLLKMIEPNRSKRISMGQIQKQIE